MPRYIEQEKAIESICKFCQAKGDCQGECVEVADMKAIPTADVQEVKRGKWITNFSSTRLICSNCNCGRRHQASLHGTYEHLPPFPKYCENCGARMDGDE